MFIFFAIIAIFIACLGLFALSAFVAEQRTKEIGIRKVNGATISEILTMLNKDFIKLVLIGLVIGSPVAWYFMKEWLSNFVFKTQIGVLPFLLAGALAIIISTITVGFQSYKAATTNPVDVLRNE